jgi:hypothetical protein
MAVKPKKGTSTLSIVNIRNLTMAEILLIDFYKKEFNEETATKIFKRLLVEYKKIHNETIKWKADSQTLREIEADLSGFVKFLEKLKTKNT